MLRCWRSAVEHFLTHCWSHALVEEDEGTNAYPSGARQRKDEICERLRASTITISDTADGAAVSTTCAVYFARMPPQHVGVARRRILPDGQVEFDDFERIARQSDDAVGGPTRPPVAGT